MLRSGPVRVTEKKLPYAAVKAGGDAASAAAKAAGVASKGMAADTRPAPSVSAKDPPRTSPSADAASEKVASKGVAHAAAHCRSGAGPFMLEMDTYRYHGHSMSDPGVTYRDREEVSGVRRARDPVEGLKNILLNHKLASAEELKAIEAKIRKEMDAAVEAAKLAPIPHTADLYADVYAAQDKDMVIRGPDLATGHGARA